MLNEYVLLKTLAILMNNRSKSLGFAEIVESTPYGMADYIYSYHYS